MKSLVSTLAALMLLVHAAPAAGASSDPLAGQPSWSPPEWSQLREGVLTWCDEAVDSADERRLLVGERWPEVEPIDLPDRLTYLVDSFALVDPDVAAMQQMLRADAAPRTVPSMGWLADESRSAFVRTNCRLYVGRWAARHGLYDEALEFLDGLTTDDVADPATLLFFQAVARQRLLQTEAALKTLDRLLQGEAYLPRRYLAVAELMRPDLAELEDDSLDHIARRMEDIRRRLQIGRADKRVREIEDGVIKSLDKLIEKVKSQQQQQAQSAMPNGSQPSRPAQDSRILPGKGPGEVTKKDVGDGSDWGDLPPRDREAALQQIGREFPAHYRDAVEQYFRRLAGSEKDRE